MSRRRGSRLRGIRLGLGTVMAIAALSVLQPKLAYAWPANVANCTANMVLTQGSTLGFGAIVNSVGGGTVTVSTSSGIVAVGVTAAGGTVSAATFTGSDSGINPNPAAGCTVRSITVTVGTATLTGPGADMTVNAMTDSVTESATGLWDYKLVPISVGGTLNVNGNQMAGAYSGTFTITIVYQ